MQSRTTKSWSNISTESNNALMAECPDIFGNSSLQKLNRMRGKARERNAPEYPLPAFEEQRYEIWFDIVYPSFKKLMISNMVFCQALEMYDEVTSMYYLRTGEEVCNAYVLIEEMIKVHCLTDDVGYLLGKAREYGLGRDFSDSFIRGNQIYLDKFNGWDLKRFIPYDFVKLYIEKIKELEESGLVVEEFGASFDVERLCPRLVFLLLICARQRMHRHYDPDFMAAILLIVYRVKFGVGEPWPREMEEFTGYEREDERFLKMESLLVVSYDHLVSIDWLGLGNNLK